MQKPKFEFKWLDHGNPPLRQPSMIIEYEADPAREDSHIHRYLAIPSICPSPRCGCFSMLFWCAPATMDGAAASFEAEHSFWFDPDTKSISLLAEAANKPQTRRLAETVSSELTDESIQQLREWYANAKLDVILSTPVSEMDIADLPDADDGQMIGFIDVFPLGLTFYFPLNAEFWAVDDQYCVQPNCDCAKTVLSFLQLKDANGNKAKAIRNPAAIQYDYKSEKFTVMQNAPTGSPPLEMLLATVKSEHPSLNAQLMKRHRILHSLYARHFLARSQALEIHSANPAVTAPRKIGRNEPCPCGSGRKFKQCCLNKSKL